jgi:hypothetical protein
MLLYKSPQPVNVIGEKALLSGSITAAVDRL